jgi:hypothetical protein
VILTDAVAPLQEEDEPAYRDDTAPVEDAVAADPPMKAAPPSGCTSFCDELLPGQKPNMPFQMSCYGRRLQVNKEALADACAAAGLGPDMHALLLAMAMIETNHCCAR